MFFSPLGKCAMRAAKIDIKEILNHKESLFWQHYNDQRSDWINQEVDYKVILKMPWDGFLNTKTGRTVIPPNRK